MNKGQHFIGREYKKICVVAVLWVAILATALYSQEIPSELRGGIQADSAIIQKALEMRKQGWAYTMPQPKSPQAAWGNHDGRTTWWVGYWTNEKTGETSSSGPVLKNGNYAGDGQGSRRWRRGGTPPAPTKIEWLLSKSGGVKPAEK
jgi:hypothetical protein